MVVVEEEQDRLVVGVEIQTHFLVDMERVVMEYKLI